MIYRFVGRPDVHLTEINRGGDPEFEVKNGHQIYFTEGVIRDLLRLHVIEAVAPTPEAVQAAFAGANQAVWKWIAENESVVELLREQGLRL